MAFATIPNRPAGSDPRAIADILADFDAILTQVNGNLDGTNVAAALLGEYRTIAQTHIRFNDTAMPAGVKYAISFPDGSARTIAASGDAGNNGGAIFFPFDPADFVISGKTPKLRLRGALLTNATAPASNFTCGMHLVSSTGGVSDNHIVTLAAAISGSTYVRTAPAGSSVLRDNSSDFSLPVAGVYVLGCQTSVSTLASGSTVSLMLQLQLHYI